MKRSSSGRGGPGFAGGKEGRPTSRGAVRGDSPEKASARKKAAQLASQAGIPQSWALQVAQGKATLNEVLTRLAREDRIEQLQRRFGLDRSTAAQVADGHQELDGVLLRQRLEAHQAEHGERSVLVEALASGAPLTLHLHGLQTATGTVVAVDAYELDLQVDGEVRRIHKLQVKLAHDAQEAARVQAAADRAVAEPRPRPQDRFHLSDRRLYPLLESRRPLRIRTLEGDLVEGRLAWIARWELGLEQAQAQVVLMRHAIAGVEEL